MMVRVFLLLFLGFSFSACEEIQSLTSPTAAEIVVFTLENPLPEVDLPSATTVSVFLASAELSTELNDAPISGATVTADSPSIPNPLSLNEVKDQAGLYEISSIENKALVYVAGESFLVTMEVEGKTHRATMTLPEAYTFDFPYTQIQAGQEITVSLAGADFDQVLVSVFNSRGEETYTNRPEDALGVYEFIISGPPESITIPGTAFPRKNEIYAVGLAGIMKASSGAFSDELNSLLSNFLAGSATLMAVYTTE